MQLTGLQKFERFIENIKSLYGGDASKLRQFNQAVAILRGNAQEYLENGMTAQKDGMAFLLDYNAEQGLKVTHVRSGWVATGYVRQLRELVEQVTPSDNPLYCDTCRRQHKKYGLEIEIKAMRDNTYRTVMLRKLNDMDALDTSANDYGIDGSGGPLEMRNMNGNTIEEVSNILKERLDKFKSTIDWMKNNFPGAGTRYDTTECGVHVHMFHKGVSRDRVLSAHSAVGLIINSYANEDWKSRVRRGYGQLYAYRAISNSRRSWCRSENNSTELRTFEAMNGAMLKWALEQTDILLTNPNTASVQKWDAYRNQNRLSQENLWERPVYTKALQYFIDERVITRDQIGSMSGWLQENYQALHDGQAITKGYFPGILASLTEPGNPVRVSVQTSNIPASHLPETLRRIIMRTATESAMAGDTTTIPIRRVTQNESGSIWCNRIMDAHANPGVFRPINVRHFRNSLRRHIEHCVLCSARLAGYVIRTSSQVPHGPVSIGNGFGLFPMRVIP